MKDLLLNSFESYKLLESENVGLSGIIGGKDKVNYDSICRWPDGTTTHSMGWWTGGNYYEDQCDDK